ACGRRQAHQAHLCHRPRRYAGNTLRWLSPAHPRICRSRRRSHFPRRRWSTFGPKSGAASSPQFRPGISQQVRAGHTGRSTGVEDMMSLKVVDTSAHDPVHKRNPGFPLDLDWVERVRMNRSALERRASTIGARRTVKKDYQLAWLLRAITMIDLTTLNSDDTPGRVERL